MAEMLPIRVLHLDLVGVGSILSIHEVITEYLGTPKVAANALMLCQEVAVDIPYVILLFAASTTLIHFFVGLDVLQ